MVLNGEMISLTLVKSSEKIIMKVRTKETYFTLMLRTRRIFMSHTVIYHYYQKELKLKSVQNFL